MALNSCQKQLTCFCYRNSGYLQASLYLAGDWNQHLQHKNHHDHCQSSSLQLCLPRYHSCILSFFYQYHHTIPHQTHHSPPKCWPHIQLSLLSVQHPALVCSWGTRFSDDTQVLIQLHLCPHFNKRLHRCSNHKVCFCADIGNFFQCLPPALHEQDFPPSLPLHPCPQPFHPTLPSP